MSYALKGYCNTYNKYYVEQWKLHIKEHQSQNNNFRSAYAMHILNEQHEHGSINDTLNSIKSANKGISKNCLQNF
jgi:hypothetical protein